MSSADEINGAEAIAGSIRHVLSMIGKDDPNNEAKLMFKTMLRPIQIVIISF